MNYEMITCLFKKTVADKGLNETTEVVWDFKQQHAEHGLIYFFSSLPVMHEDWSIYSDV